MFTIEVAMIEAEETKRLMLVKEKAEKAFPHSVFSILSVLEPPPQGGGSEFWHPLQRAA